MWRKLLFVVLLVGIGYLIWRRLQSSSEPIPPPSLTAAVQPPAPPVTSTAPPAAHGPRPVITRVHRGAPPPVPPTGAALGTADSEPRPVLTRVHQGAPPAMESASAPPRSATTESHSTETEATTDAASSLAADPTIDGRADPIHEAQQVGEPNMSSPVTATPEGGVSSAVTASVEDGESASATGEQVVHEAAIAESLAASDSANLTLIDLNQADRDALIALPGIGPVLADRIIAYREAHGPFKSVDDLINIPGIGERNIQLFRKLVYVDTNA